MVEPSLAPPVEVLHSMARAIHHRGPDDSGVFLDARSGVALAHQRLAIMDLSAASHQPMIDGSTGVVLDYNGELYNFRRLRAELEALGHTFVSTGDTEVVLKSYCEWGTDAFSRFAGMFALCLWDPRSKTMHFARDPMGIKPLYYVRISGGLAFASEVKVFRHLPGFRLQPRQAALHQYLEFGYVFDEHRTMLEHVQKLPPGFRMEVRRGEPVRATRYYSPPACDAEDPRSAAERVDELAEVLERVTAEHLIADVPVGLLLSGGLDSSIIAAYAAKHSGLQTISMGFSDSSVDERPHARVVSEFLGSRHTEVLITPGEVMHEISGGAWVFDDLFADWGTITTRLMYRRCREAGLKVVLVGEGSDELFGGYDVFDVPHRLGLWQRFRLYQRYSGRRHGRLFGPFNRAIVEYLHSTGGDGFDAVRMFESRRQLPNNYVMKVDKASMAESIEARTPYLDVRVANVAFTLPRQMLRRVRSSKHALREVAATRNLLPEAIIRREKFGAPLAASWMDEHTGFREFARQRLFDGHWCGRLGLINPMQEYFRGSAGYRFPRALSIFRNLAWRLLLLEIWSDQVLLDPTHGQAGETVRSST